MSSNYEQSNYEQSNYEQSSFYQTLGKLTKEIGINLDSAQLLQFFHYYQLLIEWNNKINLTAITEESAVITKHFIDSLLICQLTEFSNNISAKTSIIDIGTGAGFPGIPLKITYPELSIVMVDSLSKRINFLEEVTQQLNLENIISIHGRAEDLGQNQIYREQYDYAVSRAVAYLPVLLEYCLPFVKLGGYFIAFKGQEAIKEVAVSENAIIKLGGKLISSNDTSLPGGDYRNLVVIKKVSLCDYKYPRKAGIPAKRPL